MSHFELLKDYRNPEDKLCLAQVLDQYEFSKKRNQIETTNFFDLSQISLIESFLRKNQITHYTFFGGYEEAERKILFFYPDHYTRAMLEKNYMKFLKVIRIKLLENPTLPYEHRTYLGSIIKLGISREKIGDILVRNDGADLIVSSSMQNILPKELASLTRFRNSSITICELNDLQIKPKEFKSLSIIVSSLRLDNIVADLARTSRSQASTLITSNLVFVNGKCDCKVSKSIVVGDVITIRRKGKFIYRGQEKTTKSGNHVLIFDQYI